jgi:hypothetical protein
MSRYVQTVRSRALAGREAEYRDWYVATHIPEVLALDGFESAEFFCRTSILDEAHADFLCVYQLQTDDLPATQAAMTAEGLGMTASGAMDMTATEIEFFAPVPA